MSASNTWSDLANELDQWAAEDRVAECWWRDDDATQPGPKLDRLLELTATTGLLLASIPATVNSELNGIIENLPHVFIAQHGYAHINHAPRGKGVGAWELGLHRGEAAVLADLELGYQILRQLFGERFIPIVVPPWNRIDSSLLHPIAERGYWAVSMFGPRTQSQLSSGCGVVNAHCDPINWKSGPQFCGESKALGQFISHLSAKRNGLADAKEPTGMLTHHIDLDQQGWEFCAQLVSAINTHPAARWCPTAELCGEKS